MRRYVEGGPIKPDISCGSFSSEEGKNEKGKKKYEKHEEKNEKVRKKWKTEEKMEKGKKIRK